ncbi:MAG TPA: hypothetical protein VKQ72_02995, partial [Aggregatilineales bacterium]|nr:hypothetical protein [Aggregatilineales bacterium]
VLSTIALTRLDELSTLMDRGEPVAPSFWNDVTSSLYIAASEQSDPALRAKLYVAGKQTLDRLSQTGNRPDLAGSLDAVLKSVVTPTPTEMEATASPLPTATNTANVASATVKPASPINTNTMTASASPTSTLTSTPQSSPSPIFDQLRSALNSCVTDKAMIQSLTVKINAGQLGAFINEVRAQSGKKIPAACANDLIRIAQSLSH